VRLLDPRSRGGDGSAAGSSADGVYVAAGAAPGAARGWPERIAGEWWKRGGETRSIRDYFRVEDERGIDTGCSEGDGENGVSGDMRCFAWTFLRGEGGMGIGGVCAGGGGFNYHKGLKEH